MRPNDLVQEPWGTELWLFYCHLPETPHYPFLQPLLLSSYDVEDQLAKVVRPLTRESFLILVLLKTDHLPSYLISVRAIYVICKMQRGLTTKCSTSFLVVGRARCNKFPLTCRESFDVCPRAVTFKSLLIWKSPKSLYFTVSHLWHSWV